MARLPDIMADQNYLTRAGDVIDDLCNRYYGNTDSATITAVYEANRALALASQGPELAAGLVIVLPDITPAPAAPLIRLWD